jgi:threonylcarbamoyladenosine tRNA methylthiotransferase MtaB
LIHKVMKIYLDMVGCRLNQSEIETMGSQFRFAGHSLVADASSADVVVINTCTVTSAADSDSRQKVRQAIRSGAGRVVVTGCYATINPQQVINLSGSVQVVVNSEKDRLVPIVLDLPDAYFEPCTIFRQPLPGTRLRTRAFIKVQDGCDNHCTYCITRLARGDSKSLPANEILSKVQSALDGGCQEIVLTGVHLGSWGLDFAPPAQLYDLIRAILDSTTTPRLHLSSIEPWDISVQFFGLWQDARLCRHLHLPLQSGCAATLKRMGRKISPQAYAHLVRLARQLIPGISITTDVITGFPGETDDEFEESMAFINEMAFAGGHVFTFSPRPGTPAERHPYQINPATAKHRNSLLRQVFQRGQIAYRQQYLGEELSVLWLKATPIHGHQWLLSGLSDNYLPVRVVTSTRCLNQINPVHILAIEQDGLVGEILPT